MAKTWKTSIDLPAPYAETPERRVLTLEPDGIACVPILAYDSYLKVRTVSPPHVHRGCIEISYCLKGDLEYVVGDDVYPLKPGNMVVAQPDVMHRIRTWPKGISKYWMLFRLPPPKTPVLHLTMEETRWLVGELRTLPRTNFSGSDVVMRNFKRLIALYDTLSRKSAERKVRIRTAVIDLLLSVVDAAKRPAKVIPDASIRRIAQIIAEHPEREYPFGRLAEESGLAQTTFLQRFKASVGFTPHAYVIKSRVDRAKKLLAQGVSVGVISDRLGFSSPRHFATQFRAATGVVPSLWKDSC